jgi:hypothetical protein
MLSLALSLVQSVHHIIITSPHHHHHHHHIIIIIIIIIMIQRRLDVLNSVVCVRKKDTPRSEMEKTLSMATHNGLSNHDLHATVNGRRLLRFIVLCVTVVFAVF